MGTAAPYALPMSNTNTEIKINNLFIQLENVTKWSNKLITRALTGEESMRKSCATVFGESLEEIAKLQIRLTRALLRAGLISDLEGLVWAGKLPPDILFIACGRQGKGGAA